MSKGGAPFEQNKKIEELLRNARVVERQQPRTIHQETIIFNGCGLNLLLVEDQGKCVGYQFQIHDPGENKIYIFQFGQDTMNDINTWANAAPNVGEDMASDAVE
jgi:hypothetical protein